MKKLKLNVVIKEFFQNKLIELVVIKKSLKIGELENKNFKNLKMIILKKDKMNVMFFE